MTSEVALALRHRLSQVNNGALAAALVMELSSNFRMGRMSRDEFVISIVGAGILTHKSATRLASQFLSEMRGMHDVGGEIAYPEFDPGRTVGATLGTLRDLDLARHQADSGVEWDKAFWRIVGRLAVRADLAAKMSGRRLIIESAEASGRAWRRVSDGDPCAFCAMLVGRGPVYGSAESTGQIVGRERRHRRHGVQPGRTQTRGRRRLGEKFHQHCGCTVVEQIGEWIPTADEQRYIDAYDEAVNTTGGSRTTEVLGHMRQNGGFNDSPKPPTGE